MRNLTTRNGRPCRPTRSWRKKTGATVAEADGQGHEQQDRAQDHQPDQREQDVDRALGDHPERPVRAVDERQDGHPLDLLDAAAGQHQAGPGHRDPDDPPLVLAQARDRLDHRPVRGREADRHLVDDAPVEHALDLVEVAKDRPADPPVVTARAIRRAGQVADRLEAELDVARHQVGERLGGRVRAHDEDVPDVAAGGAHAQEDDADDVPAADRQERLCGEEQDQEEPADVRQLEQEERGEHDDREQQHREQDVERLAPPGPADAQAVQPLDPQDRDERDAVEERGEPAVDPRRGPGRLARHRDRTG